MVKAVFNEVERFGDSVSPLVKYRQFELTVRNLVCGRQHFFETVHGFFGPENHPVTLPSKVEQSRIVCTELCELVEDRFCISDLESGAQGAARVHYSEEV